MITSIPSPASDSETSALFNPAFCAFLLNKACGEYVDKANDAMPVTYSFLILPSALHQPTRDALPSTTASSMWGWLRSHPLVLMDFADRIRRFRPFTADAITYGLQHSVLLGSVGTLAAGTLRRRPRSLRPTEDWRACVGTAQFLGRWFGAQHADEATTLARWGVRP